jgi:hypothetical protein
VREHKKNVARKAKKLIARLPQIQHALADRRLRDAGNRGNRE